MARYRARRVVAVTAAALLMTVAAACGNDDDGASGTGGTAAASVDDGATLTLWTRAATESVSKAYAEKYNATHKNQVQVTAYPNEEYPAKLASAAGAKSLPDMFASDVVFAAQYASQGLWLDITDRFDALDVKDKVAPAHVKAATWEGKNYAVPHTIDMSVLLYNKDLYAKAGLDPNKPPTTLKEFAEQARAVDKLGGDVNGTYFGGNCGGCVEFTFWPSVWAAGGDVLDAEGNNAKIDSKEMADVFALYRSLYDEGVAAPASKDEAGPTWLGALQNGKVGIAPGPSVWLGLIEEKGVKMGVAPIPGPDGGESTFVGGDAIGIGASSTKAAQAWDFLSWTMSDEAQIEVIAKNKGVPTRTDLASNKYSSADPRVVLINSLMAKGKTPYARNFNASFNDPQSPWLKTVRGALFGDAASALSSGNSDITKSLQQS
ncbi:carbohydrate ABC transporter substrate-binding protein (CUT1 family) [Asanoa ferruginea]|uniref:Carbohydrate ABC transporter substrate-binding protein (CUT1 family) n=1 Tax=Asanoa ferruginea TaxID=53367 RepID=A0A3D9ZF42_9ACTN|nr:sugar ABC transporter substrate-binding protein [Asanoa ferruginea]REF95921.1 carbohydrate ABC transporter substrate-binding protein (CUT1 family) [Asanoa ferruginea]GIF50702.1 sugar ABC transporter substrate-binding protein [Asanoa ferruginea]